MTLLQIALLGWAAPALPLLGWSLYVWSRLVRLPLQSQVGASVYTHPLCAGCLGQVQGEGPWRLEQRPQRVASIAVFAMSLFPCINASLLLIGLIAATYFAVQKLSAALHF